MTKAEVEVDIEVMKREVLDAVHHVANYRAITPDAEDRKEIGRRIKAASIAFNEWTRAITKDAADRQQAELVRLRRAVVASRKKSKAASAGK